MKTEVQIPGIQETKRVIRVWTCYTHMLRVGSMVDTDNYTREFDVSSEIRGHNAIVRAIMDWRENPDYHGHRPGKNGGTVVLAYQVVVTTSIIITAKGFPPLPDVERVVELARWDEDTITKKVFVFTDDHTRTMTFDELQTDARWVQNQMSLPEPKREYKEFTSRHLSSLTGVAFEAFMRGHVYDTPLEILKLNPATFAALGPTVVYLPVPGLNS